ncbi:MAG TPA: YfhO family protein [Mobilitalea sp.]|nr:YfhO family protein [Mobilitalea sp.]
MKKFYKNSYFIYTCSFLLLLPIVFFPFITSGKTFVWKLDGINQHYPILVYYGKLLRGLLSGRGFPMFNFKLGLGFDTLSTMHYYAIGDPLTLLTVFMKSGNTVVIYTLLILMRFYLAGISFIIFMKYWKQEGLGVVLGALIYVFCGYSLFAGLRHPFFMNPMIYLPLLLMGAEQVLRRKKPYIMLAMVFISTVSNFYFFYYLTIITVIYIVFRYFSSYRKEYKNIITGLLLTGLRTGSYYLLGTALASFMFLPIVYAFTRNGRLNESPLMLTGYLHYDAKYYLSFFQGIFATGVYPGYWTVLSFSAITFVSFAILMGNKEYRKLQMIYLLTLLGLFIPAFGYFMNGLAYTANRWCFLFSLLVAVTFTLTYKKLFDLSKTEKRILILQLAIYAVLAFIFPSHSIVKLMFFLLLSIAIFIFALQLQWFRERKNLSSVLLFLVVFLSVGFTGYGFNAKPFHDYSKEFLNKEEVITQSRKGVLTQIPSIQDKSFYRIETYGAPALNEALTVGYHDVSGYYSLMDGTITSYFKDLEVLDQRTAIRFDNMDNRTILDGLAGVKYFVTSDPTAAPYGFTLQKQTASDKYLFYNSNALPLGYTYENYMLTKDYNNLSALEKQNAMMDTVILDQDVSYAAKKNDTDHSGIEKLNAKITPDANVSLKDNLITVTKAEATITLEYDARPNSETYIRFAKLNLAKKAKETVNFHVKGDQGPGKEVNVRSKYYNSYFGKENYLVNIGYSAYGSTKAVITFPEAITFQYDNIEVYSVSMNNYTSQVNALKKASLVNIKRYNNGIQGDITLDNKGVMALSIPYSKGWSAYVDGTKTDLLKANVMYMALPLDAGSHHITLKYETPYLKLGCFVSILAVIPLVGVILYYKRREKRYNNSIEA